MPISLYPYADTPIGSIVLWTTGSAPAGWLICDGTQYVGTDYPALYELIGTTFGSTVGGEFKVPDLRDRVPYGKSGSTSIGLIDQISLGSHSHTIAHNHSTGNQSANHTHGNTGNNSVNHTHVYFKPNTGGNTNTGAQSANHSHSTGNNSASHSHNTSSQTGNTSGDATIGSPGDLVVNFIIKAF